MAQLVVDRVVEIVSAQVELFQVGHFVRQRDDCLPGDVVAVQNQFGHGRLDVVQVLREQVVTALLVVEKVVGQVEELEVLKGFENVDDLVPVGDEIVSEVQFPDVRTTAVIVIMWLMGRNQRSTAADGVC